MTWQPMAIQTANYVSKPNNFLASHERVLFLQQIRTFPYIFGIKYAKTFTNVVFVTPSCVPTNFLTLRIYSVDVREQTAALDRHSKLNIIAVYVKSTYFIQYTFMVAASTVLIPHLHSSHMP